MSHRKARRLSRLINCLTSFGALLICSPPADDAMHGPRREYERVQLSIYDRDELWLLADARKVLP